MGSIFTRRSARVLKQSSQQFFCLYLAVFLVFPPQAWAQEPAKAEPKPQEAQPQIVAPAEAANQPNNPEVLLPRPEVKAGPGVQAQVPNSKDPKAEDKTKKKPKGELEAPVVVKRERGPLRLALHRASWMVGTAMREMLPSVLALKYVDDSLFFQPYQHCQSPYKGAAELVAALNALDEAQKAFAKFDDDRFKDLEGKAIPTLEGFFEFKKRAKDKVESEGRTCQPYFSEQVRLGSNSKSPSELTDRLMNEISRSSQGAMSAPMLLLMQTSDEAPVTIPELRAYLRILAGLRQYAGYLRTHAQNHNLSGHEAKIPDLVIGTDAGQELLNLNGEVAFIRVEAALSQPGETGKMRAMTAAKNVPRFVKCELKAQLCQTPKPSDAANESFCFCDATPDLLEKLDDDLLIGLQRKDPTKSADPKGKDQVAHRIYLDAMKKLGEKTGVFQLVMLNGTLPVNQRLSMPNACQNSPYQGLFDELNKFESRKQWIEALTESTVDYQQKLNKGLSAFPIPEPMEFPSFYTIANEIALDLVGEMAIEPTAREELIQLFKIMPFEDRIREGDRVTAQDFASHFGEKLVSWSYLIQNDLSKLSVDDWSAREAIVKKMIRDVLIYSYTDALVVYIHTLGQGRITRNKVGLDLSEGQRDQLAYLWNNKYEMRWRQHLLSADFDKYLDRVVGDNTDVTGSVAKTLLSFKSFSRINTTNKADSAADEDAMKNAIERARVHMPLAEQAVAADEAALYMRMHEQRQGAVYAALPGTKGILGYVNPWNQTNYYYDEEQITDVTKSPAPFQVKDGLNHEGMYDSLKLNPILTYDPKTGQPDPVHGDDYLHVKLGLKSIISRKIEDLGKALDKKGYTAGKLQKSFLTKVTLADGTTQDVRVESPKILAAEVMDKFSQTLNAEPKLDVGINMASRQAAVNLIKSWYFNNPGGARTYYEKSIEDLAGVVFEKNLRGFLEAKPGPLPDNAADSDKKKNEQSLASWRKSFDGVLELVGKNELVFGKPSDQKVEELLMNYDAFAAEEKQIEKLNTQLVDVNHPVRGILRQNDALSSADAFVTFCTTFKFPDNKTCLSWFDETTTTLYRSEYLRNYFEEKNLAVGMPAISGGFSVYFGKDIMVKGDDGKEHSVSMRYDGDNTVALLTEQSAEGGLEGSEQIGISTFGSLTEDGKTLKDVKILDAIYDPEAPGPLSKDVKEWLVAQRRNGDGATSQAVPPGKVTIYGKKEELDKLFVFAYLADGLTANNEWINGRWEKRPLTSLVQVKSIDVLVQATRAKQMLSSIQTTRNSLLATWLDGDEKKMGEVDAFLIDLSKRLRGKGNKEKSSLEIAKGIEYLLKKHYKDKDYAGLWIGDLQGRVGKVHTAIASGKPEEIKAVFADVSYLFSNMPDFLIARGQGTATPKWAEKKFYPTIADLLFPSWETFRIQLENRLNRVAAATDDANKEIQGINTQLSTANFAISRIEEKKFGINRYLSPFTRMELAADEKELKRLRTEIANLELRRNELRQDRDSFDELDRLLANYLPNLPQAQAVRKELGQVSAPTLWNAYFNDQFYRTTTDEWNKPIEVDYYSRKVVLSPEAVIDSLNEIAKETVPTIPVKPAVALSFMADVNKVCKQASDAKVKDAAQALFEKTTKAYLTNYFMLDSKRKRSKDDEKRMAVLRSRLRAMWELGKDAKLSFDTDFIAAYDKAKQMYVDGEHSKFDMKEFKFPTLTEACDALAKNIETVQPQVEAEKDREMLSVTVNRAYWNQVATVASHIWLSPENNLAPLFNKDEKDATKKFVWFSGGPVQESAIPFVNETNDLVAASKVVVDFFGMSSLTKEFLEKFLKGLENTNSVKGLLSADAEERLAVVNGLTLQDRVELAKRIKTYFEGVLNEEDKRSFRDPYQRTPAEGSAFGGAVEEQTETAFGESGETSGETQSSGPTKSGKQPAGQKKTTAGTTSKKKTVVTPKALVVAPSKQPVAEVKAPETKKTEEKPATASTDGKNQAATAAPAAPAATNPQGNPNFSAAKAAATGPASVAVAPSEYALLFPEEKSALKYEQWQARMESYISLWKEFRSQSSFGGRVDTLDADHKFFWLGEAIVKHFVDYTNYEIRGHRVLVPSDEGSTLGYGDAFGHVKFTQAKRRSLSEFQSYPNGAKLQIIEDIFSIFKAETDHRYNKLLELRLATEADRVALGLAPNKKAAKIEPQEIKPFFEEFKARSGERDVSSQLRFLLFYAEHFGKKKSSIEDALEKLTDKSEKKESASSVEAWRSYQAAQLKSGDDMQLVKEKSDKTFVWSWSPVGFEYKSAAAFPKFQVWWEALSQDAKAKEIFAEKRKVRTATPRVWHMFDSLESFGKHHAFEQITGLMKLADEQAKAVANPGTYPYFLALLNWNINNYGTDIDLKKNYGILTDRQKSRLMQEAVVLLDWDMKHFAGWEWILKAHGTVTDWKAVVESQRNGLVALGDRAVLTTRVATSVVENPDFGVNYGYRPTPVAPGEGRFDMPFASLQDYTAWLKDPKNYLNYRVNSDETERELFKQLVAVKGEMVGEWHLQNKNPMRRSGMTTISGVVSQSTFGREALAVTRDPETWAKRSEEIIKRAASLSITTDANELKGIIEKREAWIDFRRRIDELRQKYPYESAKVFATRGNSVANFAGWVISAEAADEIDGMLKKFATQITGSDKGVSAPDTWKNEYAAANALFQANQLMHESIFGEGKTAEEKKRLSQVLDLLNGFYHEKTLGQEYQKAMLVAANNAYGRLEKLCNLDVRGIVTDQQMLDAEEVLKESEIVFMDGMTTLLNEHLPEGANHPTYKLLVELKMKKGWFRENWENYGNPIMQLGMLALFTYAMRGGSFGKGIGATALSWSINGIFAASFIGEIGSEVDNLYISGPRRLEMLTRIRDSRVSGYMTLMKDETGIVLDSDREALAEAQTSVVGTLLRVWMAVGAAEMIGLNGRNLMGGWRWFNRTFNLKRYEEAQFQKFLKRLNLTEREFKNGDGTWKKIEDIVKLLDEKAEKVFAEALNGYLVNGSDVALPADVAKAYEAWIRKKLEMAYKSPAEQQELIYRLEDALSQVTSKKPYLSKENILSLHNSPMGPYAELRPTYFAFLGIHEDVYRMAVRGSTWMGRKTGIEWMVRPGGVLDGVNRLVEADQGLRRLLALRRFREVRDSMESSLKPLLESLFEGKAGKQEMEKFITALYDQADPLHAQIMGYLTADVGAREVFSGGRTIAFKAVDAAEREIRNRAVSDINEFRGLWSISAFSQNAGSEQFKDIAKVLATRNYRKLGYQMTAPNYGMTLVVPFIPQDEETAKKRSWKDWFTDAYRWARRRKPVVNTPDAATDGTVVGPRLYEPEVIETAHVWSGPCKEPISFGDDMWSVYRVTASNSLATAAGEEIGLVDAILAEKLTSFAVGRRAGTLKASGNLTAAEEKAYDVAYQMTRAMEIAESARVGHGWEGTSSENRDAFKAIFEKILDQPVGLSVPKAHGILFTENTSLMLSNELIETGRVIAQNLKVPQQLIDESVALLKNVETAAPTMFEREFNLQALSRALNIERGALQLEDVWVGITKEAGAGWQFVGINQRHSGDIFKNQMRGLTRPTGEPSVWEAELMFGVKRGTAEVTLAEIEARIRADFEQLLGKKLEEMPTGSVFRRIDQNLTKAKQKLIEGGSQPAPVAGDAPQPPPAAGPRDPNAPREGKATISRPKEFTKPGDEAIPKVAPSAKTDAPIPPEVRDPNRPRGITIKRPEPPADPNAKIPELTADFGGSPIPEWKPHRKLRDNPFVKPFIDANRIKPISVLEMDTADSASAAIKDLEIRLIDPKLAEDEVTALKGRLSEMRIARAMQNLDSMVESGVLVKDGPDFVAVKSALIRDAESPLVLAEPTREQADIFLVDYLNRVAVEQGQAQEFTKDSLNQVVTMRALDGFIREHHAALEKEALNFVGVPVSDEFKMQLNYLETIEAAYSARQVQRLEHDALGFAYDQLPSGAGFNLLTDPAIISRPRVLGYLVGSEPAATKFIRIFGEKNVRLHLETNDLKRISSALVEREKQLAAFQTHHRQAGDFKDDIYRMAEARRTLLERAHWRLHSQYKDGVAEVHQIPYLEPSAPPAAPAPSSGGTGTKLYIPGQD